MEENKNLVDDENLDGVSGGSHTVTFTLGGERKTESYGTQSGALARKKQVKGWGCKNVEVTWTPFTRATHYMYTAGASRPLAGQKDTQEDFCGYGM